MKTLFAIIFLFVFCGIIKCLTMMPVVFNVGLLIGILLMQLAHYLRYGKPFI
tara:strand:+ start:306 stop:461 length:156 start_codon:yes stop_codon:yes gene_type:complete